MTPALPLSPRDILALARARKEQRCPKQRPPYQIKPLRPGGMASRSINGRNGSTTTVTAILPVHNSRGRI